ncbi:MAG: Signal peptidase IB [Candidatus Hydrogenedentes bacterium ADurb.Bin170]|nr:MAG: Signal peptidase IB [Candidatus Hydrogenedentes bacterium ADurb.Bin170]
MCYLLTRSRKLRLARNSRRKKFRKTGSQTRGVRLINPEEVSYTPEAEAQETEQPKPDIRREFFELIRLVIVFLLVFWAVKFFIVEGYEVQGESMLPTLADKDRILVFKLPQHLHKVPPFQRWQPFHTGDILVLDGFGNKRLIKRLIAYNPRQPGRTVNAQSETDAPSVQDGVKVEFDRGVVRVNNWQIDESAYLSEAMRHSGERDKCTLAPGELYVLGDHRQVSKDSRSFHAVHDFQVVGKAVFRFWPLSKIGFL